MGLTLLPRNQMPVGSTTPTGIPPIPHSLPLTDPWAQEFTVPAWVNLPGDLVDYYMACMERRFSVDGLSWTPPLGNQRVKYVRAAKKLLEDLGRDRAVRFVADSINAARHPPSLQWVVRRLQKVAKGTISCPQLNFPEEKQLMLLP